MDNDAQTIALRKQITSLCPQMKDQIQKMNKLDLLQLIQSAGAKPASPKSVPKSEGVKKMTKQQMIEELIKVFPENANDLKDLQYIDIQQLYINFKQKQNSSKMKQQSKKNEPKQEHKKKKVVQNGEINVYQMKKILIDKLPQYRNDIRNLPDDQIKKMFRDLQSKTEAQQREFKAGNIHNNPTLQSGPMMSSMLRDSLRETAVPNSGPSMMSMPRMPMRQNMRYQPDQIYDNNQMLGPDGMRKRGRPKKFKDQSGGFTYDDAPNFINVQNMKQMGSKPYDFGSDFAMSQFSSSNMNQYQPQVQSGFAGNSIYDSKANIKGIKPPSQNYQPADYSNLNQQPSAAKGVVKNHKQNQKVKITFYINQSDLQDLDEKQYEQEMKKINSGQDPDKKQNNESQLNKKIAKINRANKLAVVIEKLQQVFGNKNWKVE